MKMTLSFQADPPIPYHTFHFHYKKLKARNNGNKIASLADAAEETGILVRKLLEIPNEFDILISSSDFFASRTGIGIRDMWGKYDQSKYDQVFGGFSQESIESKANGRSDPNPFIPYINSLTGAHLQKSFIKKHLLTDSDKLSIDYTLAAPILPQEAFLAKWFTFSVTHGIGVGLPIHILAVRKSWISKNENIINFKSNQPDPVSVLTLNLVLSDLINRGLSIIRNEIIYKSITLFQALEQSKNISPVLSLEADRSHTIICGITEHPLEQIKDHFLGKGISLDAYPGNHPPENIIRIANFPVHSKEQVERLADIIAAY